LSYAIKNALQVFGRNRRPPNLHQERNSRLSRSSTCSCVR
jgi:hypothetical protein